MTEPSADVSLGELAGGRSVAVAVERDLEHHGFEDLDDRRHDRPGSADGFDVELTPASVLSERLGVGSVDPLLVRLGVLLLLGVLLVPVALAIRPARTEAETVRTEQSVVIPGDDGGVPVAVDGADASATGEVGAAIVGVTADDSGATVEPSGPDAVSVDSTDTEKTTGVLSEPVTNDEASAVDTEANRLGDRDAALAATSATSDTLTEPATADADAERLVPECPHSYVAAPGDSWYAIADAANVAPSVLLDENRSTTDTLILPGDEICLPSGATVPTTSPATTAPAATDQSPTTDPPTTTPTTTATPTSRATPTTATPVAPASVAEVKQMIRDKWPADQHDMALFIADRESGFDARADNNFCCYGVFQMYYDVHHRWLDDFGVYEANDLFDAGKNIAAAYHLYERAGGWGPWGY